MSPTFFRPAFARRTRRVAPLAAALAVLATAGPYAAYAQTDATTLPTVRVSERSDPGKRSSTATKTDTTLLETPQSLSVIDDARMQAQGAQTLKDALSYTPGVIPTRYGTDSRYDWISLRGFDAYAPGFYLDGMPLRNNGNWGIWPIERYGAERIEVLRGPASVLYGQSGPGGLVNAISKRPTAEPLHELQVQLGDHQRRQLAGDLSGPLNEDGTVLYRLTALAREAELAAGGMRDDRRFLAPSLTWAPSDATRLTLLSQFGRTRAGVYLRMRPAVGSLVPTAIGTHLPSRLFESDPVYNRFDLDTAMLAALFEHRVNEVLSLRQNVRYGRLKVDYRSVQGRGFVIENLADPLDPANFARLRRTASDSKETVHALNLDNQLELRLHAGAMQHTLLFGLDYQRTRIDQVSHSGGTTTPLDIRHPVYGDPVRMPAPWYDGISTVSQTGLYVQDQVRWRERWLLTLGARYDRADSTLDSRLDGSRSDIVERKASKRAGLTYVADNGWAPYLSYSESFVPTATLDPRSGRAFRPESGRQYEAGLRFQPDGSTQSYSAAVFDLRRRNYLTYDPDYVPRQTGETLVRGLELEATLHPLPRLQLIGSYSYTPTVHVTASSNPGELGKPLSAVSRHAAALWGDYRFDSGIRVGLGARYTGANRGDLDAARAEVPAFTLFDALLGYDRDRWSLALNVHNLADRTYLSNCDAYGNCYYGEQRRVTATATYRW
ncbi:TonB-dependent siderophore receptor [Xanthomonas sacchari]|uniref:TonB-dependent siderophore receptor n=1 Tax=Xanthomonas sacchari TaxID=56458 RepID=UPI00224EAA64|nr:TonB-dependent siderophore receptor [Xanthomonas sacchari]MCW0456110.1 Ferrichrome outer membrane transporter/phage receptor [Xanthomonas sacchari]